MSQANTAKILQELVDYEGPQLLLLQTNRQRQMLAIAVVKPDMKQPFFGCEINEKTGNRYFGEKADLHYAFKQAIGKNYYFFDLSEVKNESVQLKLAKRKEADEEDFWPQVGMFSRSHTTSFRRPQVSASARRYKIDGKWAVDDFSVFHGKMSDLYALFGVINRLKTSHDKVERGFLRNTIQKRFWQGGGSYVGFYSSLWERNRDLKFGPLEIAKIQYASPGEMVLRGDKTALADISDILDVLERARESLTERYRNIRRVLKNEELLSAKPTGKFSTEAMEKFVLAQSREFATELQLDNVDDLYSSCDKNVLVFAKVILSIFRRADELHRFHAEGRVQEVG